MKQKGYTLSEMLIALMIISLISILLVPIMNSVKNIYHHPRLSDDLQMIYQIRMDLCTKKEITTNGFELYTEDAIYGYHQHRLVKKPGYVIYLQEIDNLYFIEKDKKIYLYYERNQQEYEVFLCEKM